MPFIFSYFIKRASYKDLKAVPDGLRDYARLNGLIIG
jgi:pilus assembly protein TadC